MNQPVLATYRVYLSLLAAEPFASSTDQSTCSSSRHRPSTKSGNLTLCYSKRPIEIDRNRWFTLIYHDFTKKNVGFPYRTATKISKITREIPEKSNPIDPSDRLLGGFRLALFVELHHQLLNHGLHLATDFKGSDLAVIYRPLKCKKTSFCHWLVGNILLVYG